MRIIYQGGEYEAISPEKLTRPEASLIKNKTGLTVGDLPEALKKIDLDAIAAYLLVMKKRANESAKWSDFDTLTMEDLDFESDQDDRQNDEQDDQGEDEGDESRPGPT